MPVVYKHSIAFAKVKRVYPRQWGMWVAVERSLLGVTMGATLEETSVVVFSVFLEGLVRQTGVA